MENMGRGDSIYAIRDSNEEIIYAPGIDLSRTGRTEGFENGAWLVRYDRIFGKSPARRRSDAISIHRRSSRSSKYVRGRSFDGVVVAGGDDGGGGPASCISHGIALCSSPFPKNSSMIRSVHGCSGGAAVVIFVFVVGGVAVDAAVRAASA